MIRRDAEPNAGPTASAAARSCRPRPPGPRSRAAGRPRRRPAGPEPHDRDAAVVPSARMLRPTCAEMRRASIARDVEAPRRPDRVRSRRSFSSSRSLAVVGEGVVGQPAARHVQRSCPTAATSTEADPSREPRGHTAAATSVADLHGTADGRPDARFELTARAADIRLSSGRVVHALTFDGTRLARSFASRRATSSRSSLRNERRRATGVTIHWHGVDVPNARGRRRRRDAERRAARRELHVPLPRRAGRDVLVPHAPGLVGGCPTRPLRRDRHRAARRAAPAFDPRLARTRSTGSRRSTATKAAGRHGPRRCAAGPSPARQHGQLRCRRSPSRGTPFRVLAIDGTDLHGPGDARNVALPRRRRRPGTTSATCSRRTVCASRRGNRRSRIGSEPRAVDAPSARVGAPTRDFDPLTYGTPAPDAVRCRSRRSIASFRADDHAQARLLRRHAPAAVGDQRRHLSGRAGVRRRARRPRRGHDHERLERHAPDAPARSPRRSS